MKHRRFFLIILGFLACFLATNAVVWKLRTEVLLTGPVGDLSRIGYISDVAELKKEEFDLPRRQISLEDLNGQPLGLLTIGDSFSNYGTQGRNARYQDYIASINDFNVANVNASADNILSEVYALLKRGFFDDYRPEYLLIESVERECVRNFAGPLERYIAPARAQTVLPLKTLKKTDGPRQPRVSFLNTGNFKYLQNAVLYNFSDHAYSKRVGVRELRKPLFSAGDGKKLLFYYNDIERRSLSDDSAIGRLNDNLNALSAELKRKKIKLVFMPVVDKSNLYAPYIVGDPYPKSVFFEKIRMVRKDYIFIDTKEILSRALEDGEKDTFYADDTHWSWKAPKRVFETVLFK
jgi:hypothetical protein